MVNKITIVTMGILVVLSLLSTQLLQAQPAHALSKFFNCTTRIANARHELTKAEVDLCFKQQFVDSSISVKP